MLQLTNGARASHLSSCFIFIYWVGARRASEDRRRHEEGEEEQDDDDDAFEVELWGSRCKWADWLRDGRRGSTACLRARS